VFGFDSKELERVSVSGKVFRLGDFIVGESRAKYPVIIELNSVVKTSLRSKGKYEVIATYRDSIHVEPGNEFRLRIPSDYPPSVVTRCFSVSWSLIVGVPRFKGKVLFPKKELRIRVLPPLSDKGYKVKPGGEIVVRVNKHLVKPIALLYIREWLNDGVREYSDTYEFTSSSKYMVSAGITSISIKLPQETMTGTEEIYYPLTFKAKVGDLTYGITSWIIIESENYRGIMIPVIIYL